MPVELGAIKDWAGVVASLGGAVVGAVIAFVVSTRQSSHQRKIEREKRLLEKFEQLHTLLSKVATEAALCAATIIHRVSSNQEIDPAAISGEASIDQLRMLVEFYAPTLVAEANAISIAWSKLFSLTADVVGKTEQSTELRACAAALTLSRELTMHCTAAKQKLASSVGELQQ